MFFFGAKSISDILCGSIYEDNYDVSKKAAPKASQDGFLFMVVSEKAATQILQGCCLSRLSFPDNKRPFQGLF